LRGEINKHRRDEDREMRAPSVEGLRLRDLGTTASDVFRWGGGCKKKARRLRQCLFGAAPSQMICVGPGPASCGSRKQPEGVDSAGDPILSTTSFDLICLWRYFLSLAERASLGDRHWLRCGRPGV
jgi:hypothetical protein